MRNALGFLFVACVFLTTHAANARPSDDDSSEEDRPAKRKRTSPFGPNRSEGAPPTVKKAKLKKVAKRAKPAPGDEEVVIIIEEPAPKAAKAAKAPKKAKVSKAKPREVEDDQVIVIIDDEPAKKRAK